MVEKMLQMFSFIHYYQPYFMKKDVMVGVAQLKQFDENWTKQQAIIIIALALYTVM